MKLFITIFVLFVSGNSIAQKPELLLPIGHTNDIKHALFNADASLAITIGEEESSRLWQTGSGKVIYTFRSDDAAFVEGNLIISAFADSIYLLAAASGKILKTLAQEIGDIKRINVSPNGRMVLIQSEKKLLLYDVVRKLSTQTLMTEVEITAAEFTPTGDQIIIAGEDGSLRRFDLNGNKTGEVKIHNNRIYTISFATKSNKFLTSSYDSTAYLWDLETFMPFKEIFSTSSPLIEGLINDDASHAVIRTMEGVYFIRTGEMTFIKSVKGNVSNISRNSSGNSVAISFMSSDVELRDFTTGQLLYTWNTPTSATSVTFSNDHKLALTTSGRQGDVWDVASGKLLQSFKSSLHHTNAVFFSPDGKYIVTGGHPSVLWSSTTLQPLHRLDDPDYIRTVSFSYDSRFFATTSSGMEPNQEIKIWSTDSGKIVSHWESPSAARSVVYCKKGDHLAVGADFGELSIWNIRKNTYHTYKDVHNFGVRSCSFADDCTLVTGGGDSTFAVWDIDKEKIIYRKYAHAGHLKNASISDDGFYIITTSDDTLRMWERQTARLIYTKVEKSEILSVAFNPSSKYFASSSLNYTTRIYSAETGKAIFSLDGRTATFTNDGKKIITTSEGNLIKVWNGYNGTLLYTFFSMNDDDPFVWLNNNNGIGYYYGNKNTTRLLAFRHNDKIFPFEQFDLIYNRPDKVLPVLGSTDTALMNLYYTAFLKRLRRLNLKDTSTVFNLQLPVVKILNEKTLKNITGDQLLKFSFLAGDPVNKITRYFISVNDVPISASGGIKIKEYKRSFTGNVSLKLSSGINKISISCINNKGYESLKENFYVTYVPAVNIVPITWFVGIGVSKFKDSSFNLQYAAKDVRDLSKLISSEFKNVSIDTFINTSAIKKNILAIKQKLMQSKVDDIVIISLSGHGLLDKKNDMYFGTWDMDFKRPSANGLSYTDIEDLLDGIPSRKKLLLIDACHSGEVDKDSILSISQKITPGKGLTAFVPRGVLEDYTGPGLDNSFDLMKEFFADISKNNGTIVISAAGGLELAYEDGRYSNGLFTWSIIDGLANKTADRDRNGVITVNELKDHVSRMVERISLGLQKPTSRKETLEVDWAL